MSDIKEFRVKMRLYNNRLVRLREAEGLNCREMAERLGMSYGTYLGYENMTENPISQRKGIIKPAAEKIICHFGETFEYLWPEVVLMIENNKAETELSGDIALALTGEYAQRAALPPDELLFDKEKGEMVRDAIKTLSKREQWLLKDRFGLEGRTQRTQKQCAVKMKRTHANAGRVEHKALRTLRQGSMREELRECNTDLNEEEEPQRHWWEY